MTSLTNPSAPATSPSSFVIRLTELTTLPVRQRKLRKSLPVGMGTDDGHRIESPLTDFVAVRPGIAELCGKIGRHVPCGVQCHGKADSPASSGPKRALDDRSVAGGRRQERRAWEEDDGKAAASKVASEEGARTGGTFGRAGSLRSDTCHGKSTGACAARDMAAGGDPGRRCDARGRCNRVPASITGAGRDWFGRSGTDVSLLSLSRRARRRSHRHRSRRQCRAPRLRRRPLLPQRAP